MAANVGKLTSDRRWQIDVGPTSANRLWPDVEKSWYTTCDFSDVGPTKDRWWQISADRTTRCRRRPDISVLSGEDQRL